ncbi:nicotinate-nucleotide--dimethylbenzimidazole phosphoribosyltransferase [Variovorax dokdonensis]|uniref:Nicotinate-nucleotide--dimethylbenzimidazole phosphoribosyltransferase n=1 Tax=Variovorax dokdonensis TaxID=344883 RepID=A0ABT7N8K5_9BURK|nr:nicotinate-nucleotide--dimethylbenzimidazole phosphoribosyltransferase [Variovorax dokdonensis]MDM0044253.1 nicotinate-nucleotide--dimethylbenzimidazole phosphoribosyltransferase [Variovorax dokdonensis]
MNNIDAAGSAHSDIRDLRDAAFTAEVLRLLDNKTKPVGALGRLEALALRIAQVLGDAQPVLREPQMLVCAGDHGLAGRGVSAYPADVTWQMVHNFLSGGAAVSVLARQHALALTVVDCGVRREFEPQPGLLVRRIAPGTADALVQGAMTPEQCAQAIANGREIVRGLPGNALLLGEMGIGNSSSAALLLARLGGLDLAQCVGPGTGLDATGLRHKREVLSEVLARHEQARSPLDALAALGGFEIATLVGAVLEAASQRRVIVVDGFITGAAVLVAHALQPWVTQRCVASHESAEPGHALLLHQLGLSPLLRLDLRLGEGSGAALAWPLLVSACAILREMASFDSAGVSRQSEAGGGTA